VPEALLLFNDVLNNGFDGSHFITGLSSHFRDLLVARDASTLVLLEVGASIRQRYQAQAQKCNPQFLYRAMKLCNDCDMNYRGSRNKRLLVELTLIQVAQLTIDGDDAGLGLGPKQIIKPITKQPATAQPLQAAPVAPRAAAPATVAPPDFIARLTNSGAGTTTAPTVSPEAISTSARKIMEQEQAKQNPVPAASETPQQPQAGEEKQDLPVDESRLNFHWQEFAAQLPQEYKSTAMRIQNMRIKLLDETTFEVVLDNEYVLKEFTPLRPNIESHLRKQLGNRQVKMAMRISAPTEKKMPAGKVERFHAMAQKNEALLQLKDEFGLELW
jgi:DNA polymerase-3 subunit gamma/tau